MPKFRERLRRLIVHTDDPKSRGQKSAPSVIDGMQVTGASPHLVEYITSVQGLGSYAAMYRKQSAVRNVVDFLANQVGQLTPKVYERLGNADRLELDSHPLAKLLRKPNPRVTRELLFKHTVSDLALYDRAYWMKVQLRGRTRALRRIPPIALWPRYDWRGNLEGYQTARGELIRRDQLVVFEGYDPERETGSVSPLETLRQVLEEEWAASQHRKYFWRNAARQGGVIERPADAPVWGQEARERFVEDWRAATQGAENAGATAILEDGMKLNGQSFSPKESEYLAGRELTRREVAQAFGIHPAILGLGNASPANLPEAHKELYADTLSPLLARLEGELELQLLPEFEPFDEDERVYVEFNLQDKLKGSFLEHAKVLTTTVGVPWIAPNEARAQANLPRIDDPAFDVPVKPLNILYGGQPSTQIPTQDPGSPPTPDLMAHDPLHSKARDESYAEWTQRVREQFDRETIKVFDRTFARQERAVLSDPDREWDSERWNRELSDDLFAALLPAANRFGKEAAKRVDGDWDADQIRGYIHGVAFRAAENVNAATEVMLVTEDDPQKVFEESRNGRMEELGTSLVTSVVGWATLEAARQNGS